MTIPKELRLNEQQLNRIFDYLNESDLQDDVNDLSRLKAYFERNDYARIDREDLLIMHSDILGKFPHLYESAAELLGYWN